MRRTVFDIGTDKGKSVSFPKLKPSAKTISLRLPESVLNDLRLIANKRDVPYQSLIKIFLKERIDAEFKQRVWSEIAVRRSKPSDR
jgi:predicted DNA binding CopG/RHH family protein